MIREVQENKGLNGETEKYMIRRKFIPVEMVVDQPGVFKTVRVKLSPSIKRIAGVVSTFDTLVQPIVDFGYWFAGAGEEADILDPAFITDLDYGPLNTMPFQIDEYVKEGHWFYVAIPLKSTRYLSVTSEGIKIRELGTVEIQDPKADYRGEYMVYVSKSGPGSITITINTL